jgi:hypothetical protein
VGTQHQSHKIPQEVRIGSVGSVVAWTQCCFQLDSRGPTWRHSIDHVRSHKMSKLDRLGQSSLGPNVVSSLTREIQRGSTASITQDPARDPHWICRVIALTTMDLRVNRVHGSREKFPRGSDSGSPVGSQTMNTESIQRLFVRSSADIMCQSL